MKLNKSMVAIAISAMAVSAWGQEAEATADAAAKAPAAAKVAAKMKFYTLALCSQVEGDAQVKKPDGDWEAAEEGKFYPLGSVFQVGKAGKLELKLAEEATVTIGKNSSFITRLQPLGETQRAIILNGGTVEVDLPDGLAEGMFLVTAPGFTVKNPAGESRYTYAKVGDGDKATVRCVTGSLAVEGRHFAIPVMRAADEVKISSSSDFLITQLDGTSGDYIVKLDQGVAMKASISDEGVRSEKAEPATSEWHLSPKTSVRITRMLPEIGKRMSVHMMCFDGAGTIKSECCFCEGRAEINSGELIPKEKTESAEAAKQAAEAAETTETEDTEESEEDKKDEDKEEAESSDNE